LKIDKILSGFAPKRLAVSQLRQRQGLTAVNSGERERVERRLAAILDDGVTDLDAHAKFDAAAGDDRRQR
jgi:hypothetical protein